MGHIGMFRRILICVCLLVVVFMGCAAQTEKGYTTAFCNGSFNTLMGHVHTHAKPVTDVLDNGNWASADDVAANTQLYDKKSFFARQSTVLLIWLRCLLAGITVLSVVVSAGSFYDSSSQTCGLSRILSFILAADGEKGTERQVAA